MSERSYHGATSRSQTTEMLANHGWRIKANLIKVISLSFHSVSNFTAIPSRDHELVFLNIYISFLGRLFLQKTQRKVNKETIKRPAILHAYAHD